MENITAKEFLEKTFNIDWLTHSEIETLITAMNLFAIGKCKQQKKLCSDIVDAYPMARTSELDVRLSYQVLKCPLPDDLKTFITET